MDREGWNRRYEAAELVWTAEPNQHLVAEVGGMTPGTAVDLAAGEGRNAVWLATLGWRVTAVDFSDVGLAKANRLAEAAGVELTTVCADVTEHVPEPGAFDLVVIAYLHVPADQRRVVHRRAADAVAPGGVLVVIGHDATNLTDGVGGPQDPAVLYSPDDVVTDVEGSGLVVERAARVERAVTTPDGERTAIDAVVRLRRQA